MSALSIFTAIHVLISLVGIVTGLVVLSGLLKSKMMNGWTAWFLATTVATSVTGFLFPFHGFTPAIGVGILSTLILVVTLITRYNKHLVGAWRWIYVVGAVAALYFNTFVLVVQSFLKIPVLHVLAPQGNEPPFAIAQGVVLLFYVVTGCLAIRRFKPVI